MKCAKAFALALILTVSGIPELSAQTAAGEDEGIDEIVIDEIVVRSARMRAIESGMLADTIEQTEVVTTGQLRSIQAMVLSDALVLTPGVRVNNECSMCGVKRVMLNGLGGQHTNVLIDGLQIHTMVSGFYGPDALAIAGVERIEVARGAGASLIAPEAIGGTINLVTHVPNEAGASFDLAAGENAYEQGRMIGHFANEQGSVRGLVAYQYDSRDQFDGDGNGVNENPQVQNRNLNASLAIDPTDRSTLSVRAAWTDSEIFGGPMLGDVVGSIGEALNSFDDEPSDQLFVGGDVRNRWIGKPWETTEWIATERRELSARYFHELGDNLNIEGAVSFSEHEQDSFYEGFDYRADNDLLFLDLRTHWAANDSHLFTIGADRRDETLRSESTAAAGSPDYISDSFDYLTQGIYIQDTWTPSDRLEVAIALRLDSIEADFIDPQRPGVEIDETLVSPRLDTRFRHDNRWTSRLSAGRGYRAPLSFFETDHGILDAGLGFIVDVDELERSLSLSYALSYEGDRLTATGSVAWTEVDNLAALDETADGIPILTQRDDTGEVVAVTLDIGYVLSEDLDVFLTAETFDRDEVARSIFGVAPVEDRLVTGIQWAPGRWDAFLSVAWLGERDLPRYGYEGFNDAAATLPKSQTAGAYINLDARIEYAINNRFAIYAGGRNLTDEVQVDDESPLFFDADGGYDVAYIYGQLRGRELYAGFRADF